MYNNMQSGKRAPEFSVQKNLAPCVRHTGPYHIDIWSTVKAYFVEVSHQYMKGPTRNIRAGRAFSPWKGAYSLSYRLADV